ncbi:MAG: hypothetical protein IT430_15760 [Phycisphaerales bacterium]|nr:hypothetical protein [Phycisphaerales bacterium]
MKRAPLGHGQATRRGSVLAAVIVLLLILELAIASLLMNSTSEQGIGIDRLDTVRAFYAAEAGAQMALREITIGRDEDGDGTVGGVSDDGEAANDPALGLARFHVTVTAGADATIITSEGVCGNASRVMQLIVSD